MSFSGDGQRLAFFQPILQGQAPNVWTLAVERDANGLKAGNPEPFAQTPAAERDPSFSPDGHWLAYSSDESGTTQIYVRAFPDKGGRWQISSGGGATPIFARNGKDLFFYDVAADCIMVASYTAKGDAFLAEKPRVWCNYSVALVLSGAVAAQYDVSADGKHVAAAVASIQPGSGHVIFLENFIDELQRKVPAQRQIETARLLSASWKQSGTDNNIGSDFYSARRHIGQNVDIDAECRHLQRDARYFES